MGKQTRTKKHRQNTMMISLAIVAMFAQTAFGMKGQLASALTTNSRDDVIVRAATFFSTNLGGEVSENPFVGYLNGAKDDKVKMARICQLCEDNAEFMDAVVVIVDQHPGPTWD